MTREKSKITQPAGGLKYPQVLYEPAVETNSLRAGLGLLLGMMGYVLLLSVIPTAFIWVGWKFRGEPIDFEQFSQDALKFIYPEGMLGSNLAIASLMLVCFAIYKYLHHREIKWLCSVQPGFRWRYLIACLLVSTLTLNAVYWISRIGKPVEFEAQENIAVWLALIILTSPLQAAGEEFLFRGYLMQAIGTLTTRPWIPVVVSAAIFATMHGSQNLPLFVDRFGFGLLAGALVVLTGGLEAGIAAHIVNNVFAFGYAAFGGGIAAARAMQVSTWATTFWDLAGYALTFLVAWRVGKAMKIANTTPGNKADFVLLQRNR